MRVLAKGGGLEGDDFFFVDEGVEEFCGEVVAGFAEDSTAFEPFLLAESNPTCKAPVVGHGFDFDEGEGVLGAL